MPQFLNKTNVEGITTILFDLDGVIIDSNPVIIDAWCITAKEYGVDITQEQIDQFIIGASHKYTLEKIFPGFSEEDKKAIHSRVDRREEQANCHLIEGVSEFLSALHRCPVNIGMVTSSWPEKIHHVLRQHHLDYFQCIISRHDVVKGKPDPQPYLLAMEKMQATPVSTLVFEDSDNGIRAALAAGTHCIAVNNDHFNHIHCISSFSQLSVARDQLIYRFASGGCGVKLHPSR